MIGKEPEKNKCSPKNRGDGQIYQSGGLQHLSTDTSFHVLKGS